MTTQLAATLAAIFALSIMGAFTAFCLLSIINSTRKILIHKRNKARSEAGIAYCMEELHRKSEETRSFIDRHGRRHFTNKEGKFIRSPANGDK